MYPVTVSDCERPAVYALLVFGCANAIALMPHLNPNPTEKAYRLICAYLYDAQRYINFSFVNAPYDFGDIDTRNMSILSIWHTFLKNGLFFLAFAPRREYKTTVVKF